LKPQPDQDADEYAEPMHFVPKQPMDVWYIDAYTTPFTYHYIAPRNTSLALDFFITWRSLFQVSNIKHRPRGLPGLQHWGFPVVEHERREIAENTEYTQCFLLSDSEFSGFRVRRLVNTKTLALRRFLSMSKSLVQWQVSLFHLGSGSFVPVLGSKESS
jgi:hypothetical protein